MNDRKPEIHGTGTQTRSFIYVLDTIDATVKLYDVMPPGESVNISSDGQIAIELLIHKISSIMQYTGGIINKTSRLSDVECHSGCNKKINSMIDYQPTSLDTGLCITIDWYAKLKELTTD